MKFKKLMIALTFSFILISSPIVKAINVQYETMSVPTNVSTYWKTWMSYKAITNKKSPQYKMLQQDWIYIDSNGFLRAIGEKDLGISGDYYVIALGSYYGTTIGNKYKITTDTGNVFYGILGDVKSDLHTDRTHRYTLSHNDMVEFLVNVPTLNKTVKKMGNANVYMPLNGNIAKIEKINFY